MKYARYNEKLNRRETWEEIVTRNKQMHIDKFPQLKEEIDHAYELVYDKKILPSMRSLQFAGRPVELNNVRLFNCSFTPVDHYAVFSEIMFLLLSGCGVGFSVQNHHIEKLPEIILPTKSKRYLINDSIEGWSEAVKMLCKSYFGISSAKPVFDFRDIRPKGARLITSGGKAPGPEPLKECLFQLEKMFERKKTGEKLTSLECHDIVCYLADAVLSGGIRRAALISLFNLDDEDMLTCKFGNWWESNPQRARANNTAVIIRHKIKKKAFLELWKKIELSNSGEPGFMFSNDKDFGTNPCGEIALRPYQFCNLTEINASNIESQEDLNERARAAAFIGTLQASYTDFHYLRDIWKKTTEKDALIGVGMTGIASGVVLPYDLRLAATIVVEENERVAKIIGIRKAARTTTVKPSGTSSLVVGSSSGIHAWHDKYYLRRIRVGKNEAINTYLSIYHPELIQDEYFKPHLQSVISIPQSAPEGAITRSETALDQLERVQRFNVEWVKEGHRDGSNTNNVSCTVTIDKHEWEAVGDWMWENRKTYSALSVLPQDLGTYIQAPFETITKERFEELVNHLHAIDLTKVIEMTDNTSLADQAACVGGANCEIV
jgi:ribonucleoside-diphosphate reductase alpha chain